MWPCGARPSPAWCACGPTRIFMLPCTRKRSATMMHESNANAKTKQEASMDHAQSIRSGYTLQRASAPSCLHTHDTHSHTRHTTHTLTHNTRARAASPQPRAPCLSAEGPSMALSHAESTVTSRSGLSLVTAPADHMHAARALRRSEGARGSRLAEHEGDALPAADACGPDGGRDLASRDRVGEVHRDARAGGTEGMPEGDRPAVHLPWVGKAGLVSGDATRPSSVAHARI